MNRFSAGIVILLSLATASCATGMNERDAVFNACVSRTADSRGCVDAAYRLHPETSRLRRIVWPPI